MKANDELADALEQNARNLTTLGQHNAIAINLHRAASIVRTHPPAGGAVSEAMIAAGAREDFSHGDDDGEGPRYTRIYRAMHALSTPAASGTARPVTQSEAILRGMAHACLGVSTAPPASAGSEGGDGDFVGCESCSDQRVPMEVAISAGDGYFCPKCHAEWKAEYDACEHDWRDGTDEHGEACRVCNKCSGVNFNADEQPIVTTTPANADEAGYFTREIAKLSTRIAELEADPLSDAVPLPRAESIIFLDALRSRMIAQSRRVAKSPAHALRDNDWPVASTPAMPADGGKKP